MKAPLRGRLRLAIERRLRAGRAAKATLPLAGVDGGGDFGIQMIALGVESPAERDTLAGRGVDLMQGELFAGPARDFPLPRF